MDESRHAALSKEVRRQVDELLALIEDCLNGAEDVTEAHDSLARLLEQVHARSQNIQQHLRRILTDREGDWEARAAVLDATWSQLEKVEHRAVHEHATRERPPEP